MLFISCSSPGIGLGNHIAYNFRTANFQLMYILFSGTDWSVLEQYKTINDAFDT